MNERITPLPESDSEFHDRMNSCPKCPKLEVLNAELVSALEDYIVLQKSKGIEPRYTSALLERARKVVDNG